MWGTTLCKTYSLMKGFKGNGIDKLRFLVQVFVTPTGLRLERLPT